MYNKKMCISNIRTHLNVPLLEKQALSALVKEQLTVFEMTTKELNFSSYFQSWKSYVKFVTFKDTFMIKMQHNNICFIMKKLKNQLKLK